MIMWFERVWSSLAEYLGLWIKWIIFRVDVLPEIEFSSSLMSFNRASIAWSLPQKIFSAQTFWHIQSNTEIN